MRREAIGSLVLFLIIGLAVGCSGPETATWQTHGSERWLGVHPVSESLEPGASGRWNLDLASQSLAVVEISSKSSDLELRLRQAGGGVMMVWALKRPAEAGGSTQVSWVAEDDGVWELEVAAPESGQAAGYEIRLRRMARATRQDRLRWAVTRHGYVLDRQLEKGDLPAARSSLELVVSAQEELSADAPLDLVELLRRLAVRFYFAPVSSPEARKIAEELFLRVLAIRERELGRENLEVASSHATLAHLYYDMNRWRQAEHHELQALEIRRRLLSPADPLVAESLFGLATVTFQKGSFQRAIQLLDEALEIYGLAETPDVKATADCLNLKAEILRVQDRFDEAEAIFLKGLELARLEYPDEDRVVLDLLNNLVGLYKDQGRFAQAERLFAKVVTTAEQHAHDRPYQLAQAYLNQAEVLRLQGRYDESSTFYVKALERARSLFGADNPELAFYLNQLAELYFAEGRFDTAEPLYREALDLNQRLLPEDHPELAHSLHAWANLLRATGRVQEAERHYRHALAVREKVFGPDHPEVAWTLVDSARNLFLSGQRVPAALERVERAIGILAASRAYPQVEAEALELRAELLHRRGDGSAAIASLAEAIELIERQRPRIGGSLSSRAEFLSLYLELFHRMVEWQLETGDPATAVEYAERGRARVLLDRMAANRVNLRRSIPATVRDSLERREEEVMAAAVSVRFRLDQAWSKATAVRDREDLRSLERELDRLTRELQGVRREILSQSPLWEEVITAGGRPVPLAAIQDSLVPEDGLILLYQIGRRSSYLLVIPPRPEPTEARALRWPEALGQSARQSGADGPALDATRLSGLMTGATTAEGGSVSDVLSAEDATDRLHRLWQALIPRDLWPRIQRASEIVVIPDGALHLLPFEALVVRPSTDAKAVRYWLDEGPPIRYVSSATALYNLHRGRSPRDASSVLIVSEPLFDRHLGGIYLEPLPGTAEETRRIVGVLGGGGGVAVDTLRRRTARESEVRRALERRPRWIHFATHGLVDPTRNEGRAALALTPPPGPPSHLEDDGFLQLFEIYELDLDADLVVLSACDGHVGRLVPGEGVFTLAGGFLAAGASRVVASLWQVEDVSTAVLMEDFYRRIAAAQAAGESGGYVRALFEARRKLRREPRWSEPYYWAPFILIGDQ